MNNYYYDLHIHSCLSPCCDNEMTPNNIANMAKLNGLDFIALSDHNSCKNCEAIMKVGEKIGLFVLPAMELTTSEDIHVLCLFKQLSDALSFDEEVSKSMMKIQNRTDLYGDQLILDENDNIKGTVENLLIVASGIDLYSVVNAVKKNNGIAIPAHVDKEANSLISILGSLEKDMGFSAIELSKNCDSDNFYNKNPQLKNDYSVIRNSDAHYLWDINDKINYLSLTDNTLDCFFNTLKGKF